MPENSLSKVLAAAVTAAGWHATQRRKGSAGEPYINHLLEVAALVSRVTQGEDADLVVAALIHDAVEDQGISGQTIAAIGENVAGLVLEVTDKKSLPQEVHKRLQVDQAPKKSQRAKILKLADQQTLRRSGETRRRIGRLIVNLATCNGAATWLPASGAPRPNWSECSMRAPTKLRA